jgi:hypothetical protein
MGDGAQGAFAWSASQFIPDWEEKIVSSISKCRLLLAAIPVAECIKEELDSAGDSQLVEDSVDIVPDGMFLNLEPLSDFAVLQAVGDEADHIFLARGQQWHSRGVVQVKWLDMRKSV